MYWRRVVLFQQDFANGGRLYSNTFDMASRHWWMMASESDDPGISASELLGSVLISRPADQTAAYGVRNHKKLLLAYLMQLFTTDLMVQTNFNFDHVFLCSIFFKSFFYYLGHILGKKKSAQILILSTPIDRKTMFPVDWCVQIIFLLF